MDNKHTFQIIASGSLSTDDYKVLVLLYQPLIGLNAHSIYLTLYHLINQQTYSSNQHKFIFLYDLLNVKPNICKTAISRLEAIGLVETYQQENHYLFQLKSPLTAKQFLSDTILGKFLSSEVGDKMYEIIVDNFSVEKIELDNFKKITKNFDDIYQINTVNFKDNNTYLGRKTNLGVNIETMIDYEQFVQMLPTRLKKPVLLSWKTQEHIQKLAFVYQFSLEDLVTIYQQAALSNGQIELEQLNRQAKIYYQSNQTAEPIVVSKTENKKDQSIHYLQTTPPLRIIQNYAKNDYQGMALDTVMKLIERSRLEPGVINALVLHILKRKEGVLPNINYLEKVLETWLKNGINNTNAAYEFIVSVDNQVKKETKVKKEQPEWLVEYLKELESDES